MMYVAFFLVASMVKPVSAVSWFELIFGLNEPTGLFVVPLADILQMETYSACSDIEGSCVWSAAECSANCEGSYYSCQSSTDCDMCCCVCGSILTTTTTSSTVPITTTTTQPSDDGCSCSGWYPGSCGENNCDGDERYYWRMCTPSNCLSESKCSDDAGCEVETPSVCTDECMDTATECNSHCSLLGKSGSCSTTDDCNCCCECVDNLPSHYCGDGNVDSGEDCEANSDCVQVKSKCDYSSRTYCTRDGYGECENCDCTYDSWECGSAESGDYCDNCYHCGDDKCNCGETNSTCGYDCDENNEDVVDEESGSEYCPGECTSPTECSIAGFKCDYSYEGCGCCCVETGNVTSVCEDSDEGLLKEVKGVCVIDGEEYADSCVDEYTVKEYMCGENACEFEDMECGDGMMCEDGICVQADWCEMYISQSCMDSCEGDYMEGYGECIEGVCCLEMPPRPK